MQHHCAGKDRLMVMEGHLNYLPTVPGVFLCSTKFVELYNMQLLDISTTYIARGTHVNIPLKFNA